MFKKGLHVKYKIYFQDNVFSYQKCYLLLLNAAKILFYVAKFSNIDPEIVDGKK